MREALPGLGEAGMIVALLADVVLWTALLGVDGRNRHQAAALWHSAGDRVGEALSYHRIGQVQLLLGDRQAALVAYRDACRLAEAAGFVLQGDWR